MTERQLKLKQFYTEQLAETRTHLHKARARKRALEIEGYEYESRGEIAPQEWLNDMRNAEAEYDKAYDAVCDATHQLEEFDDSLHD